VAIPGADRNGENVGTHLTVNCNQQFPGSVRGTRRNTPERIKPGDRYSLLCSHDQSHLQHSLSMPPFWQAVSILSEVQSLLRSPNATEASRRRHPRFVRTQWFYMAETLGFSFVWLGCPTDRAFRAMCHCISVFLFPTRDRNEELLDVDGRSARLPGLHRLASIRPLLRTSPSIEIGLRRDLVVWCATGSRGSPGSMVAGASFFQNLPVRIARETHGSSHV
jgi:hypothetical protein